MKERGGRVKAMPIEHADKATLQNSIYASVEAISTIYTDEHKGYTGLDSVFYKHKSVKHSAKEYVNGMAHTNGIESVWSVLKWGYNCVYHNWSRKHCHEYVDGFSFRLNKGNYPRDKQDRLDDLFRAMSGKTITYEVLTA